MSPGDLIPYLPLIIAGVLIIPIAGICGWIYTTRLRIHHGYPLEGMWGQSLKPGVGNEAVERIKLLSQENAALRAELGSLKDRLGNVERIVTDGGYHLTNQIEALRTSRTIARSTVPESEIQ